MITQCFLCDPDPALVYERDDLFFAMLGLGPVGDGYSLIATRAHCPSMLDLDSAALDQLAAFTRRVLARLTTFSADAVVGEHGRVAVCLHGAASKHEPHCLHAHQLVFPGLHRLPLDALPAAGRDVGVFDDLAGARAGLDWPGQYLLTQSKSDGVMVARVTRAVPRRLLRAYASAVSGQGDADWARHPNWPAIERARHVLGIA